MNTFVFLAVTIGALALTSSVNAQLPKNLYYYVNHTISQNDAKIRAVEIQVNITDTNFNHYIQNIRHNNYMIEKTISNYVQDLTLFGFLNKTNQDCVVKYAQVPDVDANKLAINLCLNKAVYNFQGSLTQSQSQVSSAKYYNTYIRTLVSSCYTNNKSNTQKMGECINTQIATYNGYIESNLDIATRNLFTALQLFDAISRDATSCVYNVQVELARAIENNRESLRLCQWTKAPRNTMFDEN